MHYCSIGLATRQDCASTGAALRPSPSHSMHSMRPFDTCTGRECCRLAGARYLAFPSASLREASGSLISLDPITPPSWATSQGPVRRRSTGGAALGVWGRHAPQPWSRPRRRAGRRGEQKAVGRHCPSSTPLVGGSGICCSVTGLSSDRTGPHSQFLEMRA